MFQFSMLTSVSAGRRAFSQSATRRSYESTIQNLRIHKDTKVLCQGFTGKTVSSPLPICACHHLTFVTRTGNFPREGGHRVRNQDGWRRFSEEGRPDTSRPARVRVGEGGTFAAFHNTRRLTTSSAGRSRDPAGRVGVVRASAERCRRHHRGD